MRYRLIESFTRIPVPGGKLIEEIAGRVNTQQAAFSFAHMVAKAGWWGTAEDCAVSMSGSNHPRQLKRCATNLPS